MIEYQSELFHCNELPIEESLGLLEHYAVSNNTIALKQMLFKYPYNEHSEYQELLLKYSPERDVDTIVSETPSDANDLSEASTESEDSTPASSDNTLEKNNTDISSSINEYSLPKEVIHNTDALSEPNSDSSVDQTDLKTADSHETPMQFLKVTTVESANEVLERNLSSEVEASSLAAVDETTSPNAAPAVTTVEALPSLSEVSAAVQSESENIIAVASVLSKPEDSLKTQQQETAPEATVSSSDTVLPLDGNSTKHDGDRHNISNDVVNSNNSNSSSNSDIDYSSSVAQSNRSSHDDSIVDGAIDQNITVNDIPVPVSVPVPVLSPKEEQQRRAARSYVSMATTYFQRGDMVNALKQVTIALKKASTYEDALFLRGQIHLQNGEVDKGAADLVMIYSALDSSRGNRTAGMQLLQIAQHYAQQPSTLTKSRDLFDLLLAQDHSTVNETGDVPRLLTDASLITFSNVLKGLQNYSGAIDILDVLSARYPTPPSVDDHHRPHSGQQQHLRAELLPRYAQLYEALGDVARAEDCYHQGIPLGVFKADELTLMLVRMNETGRAVAQYEEKLLHLKRILEDPDAALRNDTSALEAVDSKGSSSNAPGRGVFGRSSRSASSASSAAVSLADRRRILVTQTSNELGLVYRHLGQLYHRYLHNVSLAAEFYQNAMDLGIYDVEIRKFFATAHPARAHVPANVEGNVSSITDGGRSDTSHLHGDHDSSGDRNVTVAGEGPDAIQVVSEDRGNVTTVAGNDVQTVDAATSKDGDSVSHRVDEGVGASELNGHMETATAAIAVSTEDAGPELKVEQNATQTGSKHDHIHPSSFLHPLASTTTNQTALAVPLFYSNPRWVVKRLVQQQPPSAIGASSSSASSAVGSGMKMGGMGGLAAKMEQQMLEQQEQYQQEEDYGSFSDYAGEEEEDSVIRDSDSPFERQRKVQARANKDAARREEFEKQQRRQAALEELF